jgi:hypothetical protein
VVPTVNAEILAGLRRVLVSATTSETHPTVGQSVRSIQNVRVTWLALGRNVETLALDLAVQMRDAKLSITHQCVLVLKDSPEIRSLIVILNRKR